MLAVFVLAVLLGGTSWRIRQANQQRAAVVAIHQMHGHARYDQGTWSPARVVNPRTQPTSFVRRVLSDDFFDSVTEVTFQRANSKGYFTVNDEWMREFPEAKPDQTTLAWTPETVRQLKTHLEHLPKLTKLSFDGTRIPRGGLLVVSELTRLSDLDLESTQITSDDLVHIRSLGSLQRLNLRRTRVKDDSMVCLSSLSKLSYLSLSSTAVGDKGLAHLAKLSQLRELHIENTRVTDAGMEHLAGLRNLRVLRLTRTSVSDKGLATLKGLTNLKQLFLDIEL